MMLGNRELHQNDKHGDLENKRVRHSVFRGRQQEGAFITKYCDV